jgi:ABC-type polysaccharide transport system permease subunit
MDKRSFSKDQVRKMMNYNREEFFKNPTEVSILMNKLKIDVLILILHFRASIVLLHSLRKLMVLAG